MLASGIPAKFPIPFASSAGGSYIRSIPTASQIGIHDGYASLTDGFPPDCFIPNEAGGVPPFGQDVNGLMLQTTSWCQWLSAGAPVAWDSAFSSAIGGYPKGAVVSSVTTFGQMWLSTADSNTTNPDTGGAGWKGFNPYATGLNYYVDTGAANALVITPVPAMLAYADGLSFLVKPANANTGASTLQVGSLAAIPIVNPNGSALTNSEITIGQLMLVTYVGGSFQWLNAPFGTSPASAADIWAGSDNTRFITASAAKLAMVPQTLTYASTVTWNANLGFNAELTLAGNPIIALPSNLQTGETIALGLTEDATGGRLPTWAAGWDFGNVGPPTLSTGAGKTDYVFGYCRSPSLIKATFWKSS